MRKRKLAACLHIAALFRRVPPLALASRSFLERSYDAACHALVNALAMASGIICDGAKPSCAAKIALATEAGILGYQMYLKGTQFRGGEGILSSGVENSLNNVGLLARDGMSETDRRIIQIMLETT